MGFDFFGTRIRLEALPRCGRGLGIGADFFIFWIWGGAGLVVRMGGERRFASLVRIAAPHL